VIHARDLVHFRSIAEYSALHNSPLHFDTNTTFLCCLIRRLRAWSLRRDALRVTNKSRHDHGTVRAGMHSRSGNWSGWRHKAQVRGAIKWRSQHVHPKPRGDIKNIYTKKQKQKVVEKFLVYHWCARFSSGGCA